VSVRLAELCARMAGLHIDPARGYLIESRLAPLARREGFIGAEALLAALDLAPDPRLAWAVVEAMSPPTVGFFDDPALTDWLVSEGLPSLAGLRADGPPRVWISDCGTGQDIYALAMALDEARFGPVELYASDLSERSLEIAQGGVYSPYEVQRGLSARRLVRHFEARGEAFAVLARLRAQIRWRRVNLHDAAIPLGRFEAVVCRGLLARMVPDAATAATDRLVQAVAPGGLLVLKPGAPAPADLTPVSAPLGVFRRGAALARRAA